MCAAVLAALALCAAQGAVTQAPVNKTTTDFPHSQILGAGTPDTPDGPQTAEPPSAAGAPLTTVPTMHIMSDHGSVDDSYSTAQEWVISCTPNITVWTDIRIAPSGYNLTSDELALSNGHDQPLTCPSSGKTSLLYTPYDGAPHKVRFAWSIRGPAATVHYLSDRDSVNNAYSTQQEWIIPCTPNTTLLMNISCAPSGFKLAFLHDPLNPGMNQPVTCSASRKVTLLYTPYDGQNHNLNLQWYPGTAAPSTSAPATPVPPTASPVTVHYMAEYGSVYDSYSTAQEWVISCTPNITVWTDITYAPSGYNLTSDGLSLSNGYDQPLTCPSSGKTSLLYTPYDGAPHKVRFAWSIRGPAATVHYMSDRDSVNNAYSTQQEWIISCTPNSTLLMNISYAPSGFKLAFLHDPLNPGMNQPVTCGASRKVTLLYTPYDGQNHNLNLQWYPETAAPSTAAPATSVPPTASPVTVHYMAEYGSVYDSYSTAQKWVISCTPNITAWTDITIAPSGYNLTLDGLSLSNGHDQPLTCPSSGKLSLLYTPYDGAPHKVRFAWSIRGPAATVHYLSDRDSVNNAYSTQQEWIIPCTPNTTLLMNISCAPSGFKLAFLHDPLNPGMNQPVTCSASRKVTLLYTPYDGQNHNLNLQWYPGTAAPSTSAPATPVPPTASPVTVHYMAEYGSVYDSYSTAQKWIMSCTPNITVWTDITYAPSGYNLTSDGLSLSNGHDQPLTCPSSGKTSLLYTPYDGARHTVKFRWGIRGPAATVHYMSDRDSVSNAYSTQQEWIIPCTPNTTLLMNISYAPSGFKLAFLHDPLNPGMNQPVTCGASRKVTLLYTPYDGRSHPLSLEWSADAPAPLTPAPPSVHYVSQEDTVSKFYSTPQEWFISCTPDSTVDVTVTQLPGTLTADTTTLSRGLGTVHCPSTGHVTLSYFPSHGSSQSLIMKWAPEWEEHQSHGLSPLLIVLMATAGVLVLVGLTVAACCVCRRRGADAKADSSSEQCARCPDVTPSGVFAGLQDSCSASEVQPVSEMQEQLLVVDTVM